MSTGWRHPLKPGTRVRANRQETGHPSVTFSPGVVFEVVFVKMYDGEWGYGLQATGHPDRPRLMGVMAKDFADRGRFDVLDKDGGVVPPHDGKPPPPAKTAAELVDQMFAEERFKGKAAQYNPGLNRDHIEGRLSAFRDLRAAIQAAGF